MRLFGIVPIGRQIVGIEFPDARDGVKRLRDNGRSAIIRRWDHMIEIAPEQAGTRYVDRLEVDAGGLTAPIAFFARLFYAHRQKRWRRLARNGFDYSR